MRRFGVLLASLLFLTATPARAEDAKPKSPAEQYKLLVEEFEETGGAARFAARFFELADQHTEDPAAVDALLWVVTNRRSKPEATKALELLRTSHLSSKKLGPACQRIARTPSTAAEPLLRDLLEKSPHQNVRAAACLHLASLLEAQAVIVEQLRRKPELAEAAVQYYGNDYGKYVTAIDPADVTQKLERVYERMRKAFAEVSLGGGTMGEAAESALFRIRHLSVGRVAPEIEGEDIFGESFKLSDYRGKVVVLSFWGHW